jgi:quercetin dioxygenase-like cupin family protein
MNRLIRLGIPAALCLVVMGSAGSATGAETAQHAVVIQGSVLTGMKGMRSVILTAGGVAVMPAKAVHWFSCAGTHPCLMAVTFNQKYDIVWVETAHSNR